MGEVEGDFCGSVAGAEVGGGVVVGLVFGFGVTFLLLLLHHSQDLGHFVDPAQCMFSNYLLRCGLALGFVRELFCVDTINKAFVPTLHTDGCV